MDWSLRDVIGGTSTSVAGAVLMLVSQIIFWKVREFRAGYTGEWETNIFDDQGRIAKRDHLDVRQRAELVYGTINRIFPDAQKHRRWRFYGRLRGNDFFAIFWSKDVSVISYGCWYVHQVSDHKFSGYYLRLSDEGAQVTGIPLDIVRKTSTG